MGYSDLTGPHAGRSVENTALDTIRNVTRSAPMIYEGPAPLPEAGNSGGGEIWKLLRTLFRRKFLILATVISGIAASAFWTLRETPVYEAFATLEVQAREMQIIQGASVDPSAVA